MTLDKHKIDGIPQITVKTLPAADFDQQLIQAGYSKLGSAPAQGNRLKVWWTHPTYTRVEAIYSPDRAIAITAYHVGS
ncbi:MAG: hypothetical protein KME15_10770 [Drouetiella hepatica Uher 2000/2452]|jgi:hypothetical protein|uniref:Uncharacterized protein n=1 Tax=Drouetiella hepatica Uher 2000/2452 TaxID=904376 RepID=A0A951QD26_9CYAN|nr:hypothetical protein [Drouetiella hepatica Uher 2000/2452]